jgi:hypothetical protein
MSESWQRMDDAPRDGTLLRLWCRGVGPNPKPFECIGRFVGIGWVAVEDDHVAGVIDPQQWKPLRPA